MHSSKTKTGLSEAIPNKTTPATPKVIKVSKASAKSNSNSSPGQSLRHSVNNSPKSVESKPLVDRRLSKGNTPPDKQRRPLKSSEQQVQLVAVQDDLRKTKEQLLSLEKEKGQVIEELVAAKKSADEANEKFREALAAQKRAEEISEIEKFRTDELEQAGIEAAKKREEEWQKEVESVRNQHTADAAALLSATEELQRLKNALSLATEAKNAALGHADDAMKIAEINAKKAEDLSAEMSRLKSSLDSMLETKSNNDAELVKRLHSEINLLKEDLERAKKAEIKLNEMEALIERLKAEASDAKKAELDAISLVDEMKKKVEVLEAQIDASSQTERLASESLTLLKEKLERNEALMLGADSEIMSLRENVESLTISLGRHKVDLEDSNRHLEIAKREALEMANIVKNMKSELQNVKQEKAQAQSNEMLAVSSVQSLLGEKNKLMGELEASRDEEEKSKNAMESLASALHEVSMEARDAKEKLATNQEQLRNAESQIEELKSALERTKNEYEPMLDEMKMEVSHLEDLAEKYQAEVRCSKAKLDKKELDLAVAIKKSEEELDTIKREKDTLTEALKAEWHEKEVGFIASVKESEKEIVALKEQQDSLLNLLKESEEEAQAAQEVKEQLKNALARVESEANSAKEATEKVKAECLLLKERLQDKENELERATQENSELQIREIAALEKVEELTKLLTVAEASAGKTDENVELSSSEKSYDILPKMVGFCEENTDESDKENPKPELSLENIKESGGDDEKNAHVVEGLDANVVANKEDDVAESKMWNSCKIADEDLLSEREADPESIEDETDSKTYGDSFDQINGLLAETMENGRTSPSKKLKKKKLLLGKFGSLLKRKSSQKQH